MQSNIREAALSLGYADARPVTGHPFDVMHKHLKSLPIGQHMPMEHRPEAVSGWPLDEITIWVAIEPQLPMADWPEGCGEVAGTYMVMNNWRARRSRWEEAAVALGYEINPGADSLLPLRAAAIRAGLGVHGLNGLMITPDHGSFVGISTLLVHAAPPPEAQGPGHDLSPGCARCRACIKACPTGAISEAGVNAMICLCSYIYRYADIQEEDYPKMGRRIRGCDTCQLVCPSNAAVKREQPPADMAALLKLEELLTKPDTKQIGLSEPYVKSQAVLAAANTGRKDLLPLVEALIGSEDEVLDKMARWAVRQLR